jgi:hypothetical protein
MGILAFGGAVVGCAIGIPFGIADGVVKAVKHHKALKNQPPAAPVPVQPVLSSQEDAIFENISSLPEENRQALFTALKRKFRKDFFAANENETDAFSVALPGPILATTPIFSRKTP